MNVFVFIVYYQTNNWSYHSVENFFKNWSSISLDFLLSIERIKKEVWALQCKAWLQSWHQTFQVKEYEN